MINNYLHLVLKEIVCFTFFYLLLWPYGSWLNPLKWVLIEYCFVFFYFISHLHCIIF
jgi:hypothetical protein